MKILLIFLTKCELTYRLRITYIVIKNIYGDSYDIYKIQHTDRST